MWPFSREKRANNVQETRANIENPSVPVSSDGFLAYFGVQSAILPNVTIDSALTVPAVLAAVTFLSRTMAALPLHAYRDAKEGPKRLGGKIETVVYTAPNETMNGFKFRQYFWQQVFTGGRGLAWIERSPGGVEALWPLDPTKTVIKRLGGKILYQYNNTLTGQYFEYEPSEIIDVPFMLYPNGIFHYGPIQQASKAIQLALAMNDYGSNFFAGGGVPPLSLEGPLPAGAEALARAKAEVKRAIDSAKEKGEPILPIPAGYKLTAVGVDPAKSQMIEARRFQVEEIARAFQLPPVFLQDLTRATFSNAEQQDLHLVKHLIGQWAKAFEDELNLKLFGRGNTSRYVEHNLDGLLRGDLSSRMTAYSSAIQNAIRTPDEVRALENLPAKGGEADKLLVQGGTVPLGSQPVGTPPASDGATKPEKPAKPAAGNDNTKTKDGASAA